jgi:hypothetical protein
MSCVPKYFDFAILQKSSSAHAPQAPTGLELAACGSTWSPGVVHANHTQKKKFDPRKNSYEKKKVRTRRTFGLVC